MKTAHHTIKIDGLDIFYREAGPEDAPTIVLLHGFPSSSHMFRDLIAALKNDFHLIAPDYPGFGYSDSLGVGAFDYTFDNLADIVAQLLKAKNCDRYWLFMQDYGGPVGLRLAAAHPERVAGLLVQNANAYMDGVSEMLAAAAMPFWQNRTAATEAPLRGLVTLDGVKMQYLTGVKDAARVSPDAWTHDLVSLGRPGNVEAQLALLFNYQSNVPKFAEWQAYFREHQPPTLITWGKNDPFFTEAGARAYLKDLPKAELHLLDTGHFALEDHAGEIAQHIQNFIHKNVK
jgi:pimeloyl-ACP methyl ester carboxylesterase